MVIELKSKSFLNSVYPNLLLVEEFYKSSGLVFQNLKAEDESADYGASEFTINNQFVKFRMGKITPTKIGQFVTFWKRIGKGPILPYDYNDCFDFLVVNVHAENHLGQFIFPKAVLCEKGIVSCNGKEGKRAIRVYPPWDKTDNSQAKKTQIWQIQYFINFSEHHFDSSRLRDLFNLA